MQIGQSDASTVEYRHVAIVFHQRRSGRRPRVPDLPRVEDARLLKEYGAQNGECPTGLPGAPTNTRELPPRVDFQNIIFWTCSRTPRMTGARKFPVDASLSCVRCAH